MRSARLSNGAIRGRRFLDKRRALLDAWSEFLAGDVAVIAEGGLGHRVRRHRGECPAHVPKRVLQPALALLQPAPRTSVRNAWRPRRCRSLSLRGCVTPDAGTRLQVAEHLVLEPADRLGSDPDRRGEESPFAQRVDRRPRQPRRLLDGPSNRSTRLVITYLFLLAPARSGGRAKYAERRSPEAALQPPAPVGRLCLMCICICSMAATVVSSSASRSTTVAFDGDDPAGWVIARHTGRRNLSPKDRAHCVVRCREWAADRTACP